MVCDNVAIRPPHNESRELALPAELWSWLEIDAERHGRSIADELTWIVREHLAARRQHIPLAERWPLCERQRAAHEASLRAQ